MARSALVQACLVFLVPFSFVGTADAGLVVRIESKTVQVGTGPFDLDVWVRADSGTIQELSSYNLTFQLAQETPSPPFPRYVEFVSSTNLQGNGDYVFNTPGFFLGGTLVDVPWSNAQLAGIQDSNGFPLSTNVIPPLNDTDERLLARLTLTPAALGPDVGDQFRVSLLNLGTEFAEGPIFPPAYVDWVLDGSVENGLITFTAIPEPSSLLMMVGLGTGICGLVVLRSRRRRASIRRPG
jgi:hypothetical protein